MWSEGVRPKKIHKRMIGQYKVQHHAGRTWSLQFAVIADFCPKASSFSMTMCDHTLLLQQLPPFRNWNLRPQIVPLRVQTSLHTTIMCFAHLRKHCEDEDFTVMMRWRRQYISDFNKQNFFSTGIQKLVKTREKCNAKDSDYMGKEHLTWICIYDVHLNIMQFPLTL
jgi:hypothetical protein